jgi:CheY-like chemotaxis protein
MSLSVLQIAYYPNLLETRHAMLAADGYSVTSALGNNQGMAAATKGQFDVIVVGFSAAHPDRSLMVRWLKQHVPKVPVVALLANSGESFPEADFVTFSESPLEWLARVREACIDQH